MIEAAVRKRLDQFSLDVEIHDGGFVCVVGRNGAGKTTLLRAIAGLVKPDQGRVVVNDREVGGLPLGERGIVLVTPQSSIPGMGVDGHLRWGAELRNVVVSDKRLGEVKGALGIDCQGRVGRLSLGMRGRVALATALLASPSVILVDEAFSNLHDREDFVSSYKRLAAEAEVDVVFSSQDEADGRLADHLYAMGEGRATRRF